MNVFNADKMMVCRLLLLLIQELNWNIDAEFTGFEGNMMWFLSETTKLEANWLFLDHEVVSDTMLIDYLMFQQEHHCTYAWFDPGAFGLTTMAGKSCRWISFFFKSAGYNCSVPFFM